jgi:AcrR family transcriptional regulator
VADDQATPRRRLTRAEGKERTREQLLDAAARVFARKGYAGASVEEIAESAGYSTGALYSNFDGKEQLFLELLSARRSRAIARRADAVEAILGQDEAGSEDIFAMLSRRLERIADQSADVAALQAEFWLYAVRNPEAMQVVAAKTDELIETMTPLVAHVTEQYGADPAIPPEAVTRIVVALFQGLARQRRIDPAAVPPDLITQALRWLLAGMHPDAGAVGSADQ